MAWPRWTVKGVRRIQNDRIRSYLPDVYRYAPLYRKLWDDAGVDISKVRCVEDMRMLPFTSKSDIVPTPDDPERYKRIILQPSPDEIKRNMSTGEKIRLIGGKIFSGRSPQDVMFDRYYPIHIISTTGRSARAVPFLYTYDDLEILRLAGERMFSLAGLDPAVDTGVHAFPFAPHLAFWQVAMAGFESRLRIIHTGGGKVMGSDTILGLAARMRATFLVGTPGYIYHLANLAAHGGVELPNLRMCILGAEKVNEPFKAKLRSLFAACGARDLQVLSTYGLTEAKHAWIECTDAPDARYHLYPDFELIEVIDPETGENVAEGERGELVLTKLAGAGSVVVRYRTGDSVEGGIIIDKCPHCGRVGPLLDTRIGRESDIRKVKGVLLDFNTLFGWFAENDEIVEWQLEIGNRNDDPFEVDELRLKVALREGVDKSRFETVINDAARNDFEMKFDRFYYYTYADLAELLGMDKLPKEARIIDKRG